MNATFFGAIVVAVVIVGAGVLVQAGLLSDSYAQTAIGTILGGSIGGAGGFALGKKVGPTPVVLATDATVKPIEKVEMP